MKTLREIIYKLLDIRKYYISDDFLTSEENFYLTHKLDDKTNKMFIFFPNSKEKVGVETVRLYLKDMEKERVKNALIIVKESITTFAKAEFNKYPQYTVEFFKDTDLLVNILEHSLVPKHRLISSQEKEMLCKQMNIKTTDLPKIISNDPISRFYGAKKGQVFEITRNSETCGDNLYYRVVV